MLPVWFAVQQSQLLGGDPGPAGLLVDVAGVKAGEQPIPRPLGVMLEPAAQHPADAVQRVVAASAVPGRLVLHPAADLVHGVEAELHYVKRVQHPHRLRQGSAQRGGVANDWAPPTNPVAPVTTSLMATPPET